LFVLSLEGSEVVSWVDGANDQVQEVTGFLSGTEVLLSSPVGLEFGEIGGDHGLVHQEVLGDGLLELGLVGEDLGPGFDSKDVRGEVLTSFELSGKFGSESLEVFNGLCPVFALNIGESLGKVTFETMATVVAFLNLSEVVLLNEGVQESGDEERDGLGSDWGKGSLSSSIASLVILAGDLESSGGVESGVTLLFVTSNTRLRVGISSNAGGLAVFESTDCEISKGSRARIREFLSLGHAASNTRAVHLEDGSALILSAETSTGANISSKVRADSGPSGFVGIRSAVDSVCDLSHKFS